MGMPVPAVEVAVAAVEARMKRMKMTTRRRRRVRRDGITATQEVRKRHTASSTRILAARSGRERHSRCRFGRRHRYRRWRDRDGRLWNLLHLRCWRSNNDTRSFITIAEQKPARAHAALRDLLMRHRTTS